MIGEYYISLCTFICFHQAVIFSPNLLNNNIDNSYVQPKLLTEPKFVSLS